MSDLANSALNSMTGSIDDISSQIAEFSNKSDLSEADMIEFNMLATEYSTMMSLASGLIKKLTEAEEGVAQKM